MIEKWIHIGETGGDPWILPIFSAINAAVQKGRCTDIGIDRRELAIHVSTRLNILPVTVDRVNSGWRALYAEVQEFQDENVFEDGKEAYAMLVNKKILYSLLADIDSFLFETNSCCELMGRLLKELHEHKGAPIKGEPGKFLAKLLVQNGQEKDWFVLLDKQRNFFIHDGAPFLAIDVTTAAPDLIIMNENLKSFKNTKKYTTISELSKIVTGFSSAKMILQEYLISFYSK